jgi:hypothetical protein
VRCGRCGNDNAEANRFCGMCGAPLLANTQADARQTSPPAPPSAPASSVPSIYGLNTPAEQTEHPAGPRASSPRSSLQPSSRNLDYLLEDDDEEPKRRWGKLILVLVALTLAAGFGYLHWKQGGFDWVSGGEKKPAVAVPSDGAQSATDSGTTTASVPSDTSEAHPAPAQTAPAQTATPSSATQNDAAQNAVSQSVPSATPPSDSNSPASSASQPAASDSAGGGSDKPSAPTEPNSRPKAATPKPAAAKPLDTVTEAERYIYGRGVQQQCDHGLRLLKRATDQSNAKAMISMGALYSTGTCTPRDLPTAYRWFAMALHKDPDNQALQDDLQKLWGQMTPPERQLAIKLSQ